MTLYTIVLCKIDQCSCKKAAWKSQQRQLEKVKAGAYIVSVDGKTAVYRLEAREIFEKVCFSCP